MPQRYDDKRSEVSRRATPGKLYAVGLRAIRHYRRIRKRVFRRFPPFAVESTSDLFGYLNPLKLVLTAVAIWSCPEHFFKQINKIVQGKSILFPNPLKLVTTTATMLVFFGGLASLRLTNFAVIAYVVAAACLTPIWATPPSMVVLVARGMFNMHGLAGGSLSFYYAKLNRLAFKPTLEDSAAFSRLLDVKTYIALDYKIALYGYLYLTVYFGFAIAFFLLVALTGFAVILGAVSSGGLLAGIIIFVMPALCLMLFGDGGGSLFVEPYLQMLSSCTPLPDRNTLEVDFKSIAEKASRQILFLPRKVPLQVGYPIDEEFVAGIALMWCGQRPLFLAREQEALKKGRQASARFLIERTRQTRDIGLGLYVLEMEKSDWYYRAADMQTDLELMLKGSLIDGYRPRRPPLALEQLRVFLSKDCRPETATTFLSLWNRTALPLTCVQLDAPSRSS
jgi:hypothetical protein